MIHHFPPMGWLRTLFRKIYWWCKGNLFFGSVLASHKEWLVKTGLGSDWEEIGEDIEYSLSVARWPEGPDASKIALRTKNGTKFDSVTFVVEASGGKLTCDATGTISFLSELPRYTTLVGFPVSRTYVSEGSTYRSYGDYTVYITQVTENRVSKHVHLGTLSAHPVDQLMPTVATGSGGQERRPTLP
jgi:hypothetical protein